MATILDKHNKIKEIDRSNMLNHLTKTPEYCQDAIKRTEQTNIPKKTKPKNIIILGMGGSAIGGEILKDWLRDQLPIPIEVTRDYTLPAYANKNTLILANSYSGNTEETLTAFLTAIHRKCTTITITSNGHLETLSKKLQIPHIIIPKGLPPRAAIPYLFFPLPIILQKLEILPNIKDELQETIQILKKTTKENAPTIPTKNNQAKQIAQKIMGTIPVIYGFRQYTSIAHRLKAQFNENSKIPSKIDTFPELNHNETVGYEAPEALTKKQTIILIRDPQEPPEIKNRIETTKTLVFNKANKTLQITAQGKTRLAKMFSVLSIGDYASVYLAILQNIDPTPVKIIEKVKKELAKKTNIKEKIKAEIEKLQ